MESRYTAVERPGLQWGDPAGGFVYVRGVDLCRLWQSFQEGLIEFRDVRAWLAAQEMLARRCELDDTRSPDFTLRELRRLVGGREKGLKASLARLEAFELLIWSNTLLRVPTPSKAILERLTGLPAMLEAVKNHKRLVPVPRRTLRLLAQTGKPSVVAAALGHLFRCLYRDGEACRSWGTCKASWLAETFGVDVRNVKAARRHLVKLGWLVPVESDHWHRQRWGGCFVVSLTWARPDSYVRPCGGEGQIPTAAAGPIIPQSPPRASQNGLQSPPPCKQESSFQESKNQEPAAGGPTGFSTKESKTEKAPETVKAPTWRHVEQCDLTDTARTLDLFEQAVAKGDIEQSEANRLRFVTAAEHALVKGSRNPCGLFVDLVKKKLWRHCTEADEEAALTRLKRYERRRFERDHPARRPRSEYTTAIRERTVVEVSDDARMAAALLAVAQQKRLNPMTLVRAMKKPWSLEELLALGEQADAARFKRLSLTVTAETSEA